MSGDLLFVAKGSQKYIPTLKRAVPQLWDTSNGTCITKKVGEISLSFVEYSASKSIKLIPDIVEYKAGASEPLYNLIIGKQTLYDIRAVLDFKEKTITIDSSGGESSQMAYLTEEMTKMSKLVKKLKKSKKHGKKRARDSSDSSDSDSD